MRKTFFYVAAALIIVGAGIGVVLDATKSNDEEPVELQMLSVETLPEVNVEQCVNLDKQYMYSTYGEYKYFETCILTVDYLDSDTSDVQVAGVTNVFQVQTKVGKGTKVNVYAIGHTLEGTEIDVKEDAFWIEDLDLCQDTTQFITFAEATDALFATNCPKPHSRHCVLRNAVGPKQANAQYIFGNQDLNYHVDAVTGAVSDVNPWGLPEGDQEPY